MFNRRSVMSQIAIYCHDATKMALLQSWPAGGGMAGRWREAPQGLLSQASRCSGPAEAMPPPLGLATRVPSRKRGPTATACRNRTNCALSCSEPL
ncbi:hypothetical protein FW320_25060 [Azospirillum sp. Vi22]|nr:hypothetical protein [Azospirillum baldaniorum]